jgi:hypothetical protein
MNRHTSVAYALAVAAVCLSVPASAADLPKSGTYTAHYGWTFSGQVQELGANRVVYVGYFCPTPANVKSAESGIASRTERLIHAEKPCPGEVYPSWTSVTESVMKYGLLATFRK